MVAVVYDQTSGVSLRLRVSNESLVYRLPLGSFLSPVTLAAARIPGKRGAIRWDARDPGQVRNYQGRLPSEQIVRVCFRVEFCGVVSFGRQPASRWSRCI